MNVEVFNSILNVGANALLFVAGMYFYYHHITKKIGLFNYHLLRIAVAMLISGALMRCLVDINYIIAGKAPGFVWYEAVIALLRNYGLGMILFYSVVQLKGIKDKFNC